MKTDHDVRHDLQTNSSLLVKHGCQLRHQHEFGATSISLPYKEPSRFVLALKWGGCLTAGVFAVGGLLLDVASLDQPHETLSRGSWVIASLAMAVGFIGAVLDRSSDLPKSLGSRVNE